MAQSLSFRGWTHPADLHVTLHFIGDTPASRVEALSAAAAAAASLAAPFALALTEPGAFGAPSAPRVLWCGLAEPAAPGGALTALHAALGARLNASGFATEARPFRAHATLARGWTGAAADDGGAAELIAAAWRAAPGGPPSEASAAWIADRVTLFRTYLGKRPSYEPMGVFPLGRKA